MEKQVKMCFSFQYVKQIKGGRFKSKIKQFFIQKEILFKILQYNGHK